MCLNGENISLVSMQHAQMFVCCLMAIFYFQVDGAAGIGEVDLAKWPAGQFNGVT